MAARVSYWADFTGHGTVELLRLQVVGGTVANRLYTKINSTPPDQLVSVKSPTGAITTLYYVPLTSPTPAKGGASADLGPRYFSDRGVSGRGVANAIDVSIPTYVVVTTTSDSGVGSSKLTSEFSYAGLKADLQGRGLLGFREVLRQRQAPDGSSLMTVDTQYLMSHPYIGVASRSDTYIAPLNLVAAQKAISSATYVYCDQTVDLGASGPAAAATTAAPCPATSKVARPYVYQSTETGTDLKGIALPQVVTTNTYTSSGDPAVVTTKTSGTAAAVAQIVTKTTTNQYVADNTACSDYRTCAWVLGRLSQSSVANSVPNSLGQIATAAGSSSTATLTSGVGPLQSAVLTPPSYSFGNLSPGASSSKTFVLANDGASPLTLTVPSAASVSGTDFSFVSTTCVASLAPAASCGVTVRFAPTAIASRTGTLTLATGATTFTSMLTGVGGGSTATLTSAASQTVASAWYGAPDRSVSVTYRNDGNAVMTLSTPTLTAPLSVGSNGCTNVAPGASCSMVVNVVSTVPGIAQTQSFTPAGANTAPTATSITWTTTSAVPRWGVTSLNFGSVAVGGSASQNITLFNDGNIAYNWAFDSAIANGVAGFSFNTSGCSSVGAAGGSCTVVATFAPTAGRAYSGAGIAMSVVSYTANTLAVSGVGITPASVSVSATSISATSVWPTPASGSVTFTNSGQTPTTLTFSASGGSSVLPTTLSCPAGGSCGSVTVTSPAIRGSYPGTLSITSSAGGAPTAVALTLTVNGSVASLTNNSSSLTFPSTTAGAAAPTVFWAFQNTGDANLTLTPGALNSPFAWTANTCANVIPLAQCSMVAQMTTSTVGTFSQSGITVTGAAQGNRSDLSLSGAVGAGATTISASPTSLAFGVVAKGTNSAAKSLTLTNTGSIAAGLLSPTLIYIGGSFAQGNFNAGGGTCGSTLAPGASCTLSVSFSGGCTGGGVTNTLTILGTNFTAVPVTLSATNSNSGFCP